MGLAALNVGTAAGTVAAGDHTHSGYAATSHTHTASQISDSTATGRSVLTAADAAAARTAIGAGTSSLALGTTGSTAAAGNHTHTGFASSTAPGLVGRYVSVNAQTGTTYTPALSDEGALVTLTNAAAITVTLPQGSTLAFPIGGRIDFVGMGAGLVTFAAGSGATVNGTPSLVSRAQYSAISAVKVSTNGWLIVGDLA